MNHVGEFEKVSLGQFREAIANEFYKGQELPPEVEQEIKRMWEGIALPHRATTGSAGYDFKAPFTFELRPGETMKIPTGVRVKIDDGWWLGCLPRSGLGFKFRLQLDNTMGVIATQLSMRLSIRIAMWRKRLSGVWISKESEPR